MSDESFHDVINRQVLLFQRETGEWEKHVVFASLYFYVEKQAFASFKERDHIKGFLFDCEDVLFISRNLLALQSKCFIKKYREDEKEEEMRDIALAISLSRLYLRLSKKYLGDDILNIYKKSGEDNIKFR